MTLRADGVTVLVVEDYPAARKALCLLLSSFGATTLSAEDGQAALALALERRPQLVLCDVRMPRMDGFEFIKRLRADPASQGMRVVAMSGVGSDADLQLVASSGFDDHIMKPVDTQKIAEQLARVVKPTN
jgi:CheY-like chemotaxis protein